MKYSYLKSRCRLLLDKGYVKHKGLKLYSKEFHNGILKDTHVVPNHEVYSISNFEQFLIYYENLYAQRLSGLRNIFDFHVFKRKN